MFEDLLNPVKTTVEATPGLFRKAGPGPVRFTPVIALGLETRNRGGWYAAASPPDAAPKKVELWSYVFKNTTEDLRTGKNLPPPLAEGSSTEFEPGDGPFGFWISNDGLNDGGVFSQPGLVSRINQRLAQQPYKAMIYPYRDKAIGQDHPPQLPDRLGILDERRFPGRRLPRGQREPGPEADPGAALGLFDIYGGRPEGG